MQTPKVVRLGIIGLGNIAQQHIQHVHQKHVKQCHITAVCSRTQPKGIHLKGAQHFTCFETLIDSGLCDAVLIATPSFNHLQIGLYALSAGLHVLMEKPIGLSIAEGEQLLDAKPDDRIFALMLNQRCDPLYQRMREQVINGAIGDITRVNWTMTNWFRPEVYFQVSDWRATWRGEGGGLLVNQCIHNLDIYQWICGMPTKLRAFCHFGKYHDIEVEDEAHAYFEFGNGSTGTFTGSTGEAPGLNCFDIIGDKGRLSFDGHSLIHVKNTSATSEFSKTTRNMFGMPETSSSDITPQRDNNQHADIINNFCQAILVNEPLIAPAEEGLHSLTIANAMLLSTWHNKDIELPLNASNYQQALDQRIANSTLRKKSNIDVHIDMGNSYK